MLFGVGVSCHILYSIVSYLYVSYSESITSVGEERAIFFCYRLLVIMWFLFGGVSSSSWCLGWAALFYCGTPCAFHIIIIPRIFILNVMLNGFAVYYCHIVNTGTSFHSYMAYKIAPKMAADI